MTDHRDQHRPPVLVGTPAVNRGWYDQHIVSAQQQLAVLSDDSDLSIEDDVHVRGVGPVQRTFQMRPIRVNWQRRRPSPHSMAKSVPTTSLADGAPAASAVQISVTSIVVAGNTPKLVKSDAVGLRSSTPSRFS
jgi:hypothetical protein